MRSFKKLVLANAISGLLAAGGVQAATVGYSMSAGPYEDNIRLADMPVNDATAANSSNPAHSNYDAPYQWRDSSGALITAPNYGWAQGGGLPATWYAKLGGAVDTANMTSQDFVAARETGGFNPVTPIQLGVDEFGDPIFDVDYSPSALQVAARSYLDWSNAGGATNWGHNADFGLLHLDNNGDVTITVSGISTASGELIGNGTQNLRPGFTIWKGWDSNAGTRHTTWQKNGAPGPGFSYADDPFPGAQSMKQSGEIRQASDIKALVAGVDYSAITKSGVGTGATAYNPVANSTATMVLLGLAAGDYTIVIGGFCGRNGNVSSGALQCSTGSNNQYKASISLVNGTSSVPVPAAAWLFGPALAGLGMFRRRVKR